MRIFTDMESPAEYHVTPPLLRPLNPQEHREVKLLNDALTQAKISLNDRHAELRMMRVGVEELTKRALKAEATLDETWKLVDAFRHKLDASEQKIGALNMAKIHGETTAQHLASCEAALEQRNQALDAATARAEKAEARVKEQQVELGEQERDKLALLIELQSRAK